MIDEEMRARIAAAVFARSPCHVALVDRQHQLLLANAAFERTFGPCPQASCFRLYKGRGEPCESCIAESVFASREERTADEQGVTAAGKVIYYRVQAMPLANAGGEVEHVLLVSTDVTRVIELEQGLNAAEQLAKVGLSTAGLAHTIKNILTGLDGGRYLVDSAIEKGDAERLRTGWEMVQGYVSQVQGLVQNLLSYSRPRQAQREWLEPADLVCNVVQLYARKASEAGIALSATADSGLPRIDVDRESIHAALANLVTNAIDACTWDPDVDKEHHVTIAALARDGGGLRFEVSDNGAGISADNQRKVLVALFTTKGMRGTGLGLLLTKKSAEEHGGCVSFSSTPGHGTTFCIDLPAVTPAAGQPPPAAPARA